MRQSKPGAPGRIITPEAAYKVGTILGRHENPGARYCPSAWHISTTLIRARAGVGGRCQLCGETDLAPPKKEGP